MASILSQRSVDHRLPRVEGRDGTDSMWIWSVEACLKHHGARLPDRLEHSADERLNLKAAVDLRETAIIIDRTSAHLGLSPKVGDDGGGGPRDGGVVRHQTKSYHRRHLLESQNRLLAAPAPRRQAGHIVRRDLVRPVHFLPAAQLEQVPVALLMPLPRVDLA